MCFFVRLLGACDFALRENLRRPSTRNFTTRVHFCLSYCVRNVHRSNFASNKWQMLVCFAVHDRFLHCNMLHLTNSCPKIHNTRTCLSNVLHRASVVRLLRIPPLRRNGRPAGLPWRCPHFAGSGAVDGKVKEAEGHNLVTSCFVWLFNMFKLDSES